MRDSERVKMCDRPGVNNRYTGYRHNLNRGNLDPVRIGYAWMDGQPNQPPNPKWTPEPKWTPPNSKGTASKCTCEIPYQCKKKAEPEVRPAEKDPVYCGGNKAPLAVNLVQEPPNECSQTFKPIPNLTAEYKCEDILLPVPLPERPKSQPKCDYQATKSLCVSKCVPVPRTKSAEKVCCCTAQDLAPQYVCANGQSDADPDNYIRKPRRECYIKNGCEKKADLDSFETPRNYFLPQPPICRPGKTIEFFLNDFR